MPTVDQKRVLNQARGFFLAGQRCDKRITKPGSTEIEWLPMPAIVCFSFSIEVFLKGLILWATGNTPRGHGLKDLFDLVPPGHQSAISDAYTGNPPLLDLLHQCDRYFERVRYIYEEMDTPFSILLKPVSDFAEIIGKYLSDQLGETW